MVYQGKWHDLEILWFFLFVLLISVFYEAICFDVNKEINNKYEQLNVPTKWYEITIILFLHKIETISIFYIK